MSNLRGRTLPEVRPRDVDGFGRAVAAGLVPQVLQEPPELLPGRTAQQVFRMFLLKSAVTVAILLLVVEIVQRVVPSAAAAAVTPVLGLLSLGLIFFQFWRGVGNRSAQELQHGYTTFRMQYGGFWWGEGRRWKGLGRRAPWDYSGLWVLDTNGRRILSPPNRSVDPPGFYPSPNRHGSLELWTGVVWSGRYRKNTSFVR